MTKSGIPASTPAECCEADHVPDAQTAWMAAMRRGDYPAAWAVSDAVLAGRNLATRDDPRVPYHHRWVWDGRSVHGRDVLVRCYHGLGDTLQFARYWPVLRAQATRLTVELQPELLPLLARLPGPDRLIAFDPAHPLPPSDCDLEIMELAHALRVRPADVAPACPQVTPWRLPAGSIGLCWQAGGWDPERSVPFAALTPLCAAGSWVSLQPSAAPPGACWHNPQGCPVAIADAAALIAGVSLVITVDTMVAHLAGTLGRPTWLLLKHDADWRWMADRADCPWYPSVRLYRQPTPGDWDCVIRQISADLRDHTAWPAHQPLDQAH